jgi:hypothetical protein
MDKTTKSYAELLATNPADIKALEKDIEQKRRNLESRKVLQRVLEDIRAASGSTEDVLAFLRLLPEGICAYCNEPRPLYKFRVICNVCSTAAYPAEAITVSRIEEDFQHAECDA